MTARQRIDSRGMSGDKVSILIGQLRQEVNAPIAGHEGLYARVGDLRQLGAVLQSLTTRAACAAGRLPTAAEGLRVDGSGGLLAPDQVRTEAVEDLRDAVDLIGQALTALDRAQQHLSSVYVQDGSLADQLRTED